MLHSLSVEVRSASTWAVGRRR
uniref:Uncharacterized protein n=1 Tax=Arundo donax TaxID=35708 RepID=A0A0A8YRW2_ARUDO